MTSSDSSFDVLRSARDSEDFRREVVTGRHGQVVLMTLPPGEEIGEETHPDVDQMLLFLEGEGEAVLEGETSSVGPNRLVFVQAGVRHNFRNTGSVPLRLVTVYAPPEHPAGTVHRTKAEADAAEHH